MKTHKEMGGEKVKQKKVKVGEVDKKVNNIEEFAVGIDNDLRLVMEGFARTKTEFEAKVTDVEARLEEVAAACEAKVNNAIRLAEQMSAEVDAKIAKLEERVTAALEEKFNDALMKSEDIIARVKNLEVTVEDSAASAKELALDVVTQEDLENREVRLISLVTEQITREGNKFGEQLKTRYNIF